MLNELKINGDYGKEVIELEVVKDMLSSFILDYTIKTNYITNTYNDYTHYLEEVLTLMISVSNNNNLLIDNKYKEFIEEYSKILNTLKLNQLLYRDNVLNLIYLNKKKVYYSKILEKLHKFMIRYRNGYYNDRGCIVCRDDLLLYSDMFSILNNERNLDIDDELRIKRFLKCMKKFKRINIP